MFVCRQDRLHVMCMRPTAPQANSRRAGCVVAGFIPGLWVGEGRGGGGYVHTNPGTSSPAPSSLSSVNWNWSGCFCACAGMAGEFNWDGRNSSLTWHHVCGRLPQKWYFYISCSGRDTAQPRRDMFHPVPYAGPDRCVFDPPAFDPSRIRDEAAFVSDYGDGGLIDSDGPRHATTRNADRYQA